MQMGHINTVTCNNGTYMYGYMVKITAKQINYASYGQFKQQLETFCFGIN